MSQTNTQLCSGVLSLLPGLHCQRYIQD